MYVCIFWQQFFVNINFIKYNRHFLSTYFFLDPFVFPYCFYRIRRELIYVLSIVVCIPSTFYSNLGHHQGRTYYESDVTCFCILLLCKSVFTVEDYIYIYIYIYYYWNLTIKLLGARGVFSSFIEVRSLSLITFLVGSIRSIQIYDINPS